MKERYYQNENKVYVKVEALFSPEGQLKPVSFWWEDGRKFVIDRVLDICRAASTKAGGIGVRYTCRVLGKEIYLFFEGERWFMERK